MEAKMRPTCSLREEKMEKNVCDSHTLTSLWNCWWKKQNKICDSFDSGGVGVIFTFYCRLSGSACMETKMVWIGEGWMAGKKEMAHGHENNNTTSLQHSRLKLSPLLTWRCVCATSLSPFFQIFLSLSAWLLHDFFFSFSLCTFLRHEKTRRRKKKYSQPL